MAMPTTGTLYLNDSSQASVCRSIAHAVYTRIPSPVSLSNAGATAGFSGSISHSCFYGYPPTLSVSPTSVTFLAGGGTQTITVTASAGNSWTATSNQGWAIISNGSGTGNGSFTIQAFQWLEISNRTATVTVSSNAPNVTIQVTQFGFS